MKHLTKEQRYVISALKKRGVSQVEISQELGVHKSTISREIRRNSKKSGSYNPNFANQLSTERKERFASNRVFTKSIEKYVINKIKEEQWSPEQIVGYCRTNNIDMVSIERIYQFIRQDKEQGGTLYKHLRHQLKHRKRPFSGKKVIIKDKVSINQRGDIINNKERFGDWEIDLIVGKENKGAIVTIVERKTAFFLMKKLPKGKNAEGLAEQVNEMLLPYKDVVLSITSDNGTEFATHKKIAKKLSSKFFFANPYCSWERGLSEYTNKLVRQYIPKKTKFKEYSELEIKNIQHKINRRPRKNLNYNNPKNLFYKFVNQQKVAFAS